MKKLLLLFFVFAFAKMFSQKNTGLDNIENVQIFLFEDSCINQSSYYKLEEKKQQELIQNYSSLSDFPLQYCPDYINPSRCTLSKQPFLQGDDIISFNWNTKVLILSEEGRRKLNSIKFKYFGEPFALKVKNEVILYAWFWSYGSSQVCFRVYGQLYPDNNKITLRFNKGFGCGNNPLDDKSVDERIIELQNLR